MAWQNISNAKIIAPFDATVTEKYGDEWQVVWPWMPIYQIANLKRLKFVTYISEQEAKQLELGQTGYLHLDDQEEICQAYISNIAPSADMMTKKRTIELLPQNCKSDITAGTYAKIEINNNQQTQKLIANDFIEYQYGNSFVYKATNNQLWESRIPIKILTCDNAYCSVEWEIEIWDEIIKK